MFDNFKQYWDDNLSLIYFCKRSHRSVAIRMSCPEFRHGKSKSPTLDQMEHIHLILCHLKHSHYTIFREKITQSSMKYLALKLFPRLQPTLGPWLKVKRPTQVTIIPPALNFEDTHITLKLCQARGSGLRFKAISSFLKRGAISEMLPIPLQAEIIFTYP